MGVFCSFVNQNNFCQPGPLGVGDSARLTRKWDDGGKKRYSTEIVLKQFGGEIDRAAGPRPNGGTTGSGAAGVTGTGLGRETGRGAPVPWPHSLTVMGLPRVYCTRHYQIELSMARSPACRG
jgi:hypothetical protein